MHVTGTQPGQSVSTVGHSRRRLAVDSNVGERETGHQDRAHSAHAEHPTLPGPAGPEPTSYATGTATAVWHGEVLNYLPSEYISLN